MYYSSTDRKERAWKHVRRRHGRAAAHHHAHEQGPPQLRTPPYLSPTSSSPLSDRFPFSKLQRYIEHYNSASRWTSRSAELTGVTLDALTITAGGRAYTVPLAPPLASFRDVRERVVQMDREATAGLRRSSVTLTEYRAARGAQAVVFAGIVASALFLSREANMAPGSLLYQVAPGIAEMCLRSRLVVGGIVGALHVAEVAYLTTYVQ